MTELIKGKEVNFHIDVQIVLGLIFSASAILSYFHKTPFPHDMPLIITCMVIYHVAYYGNQLFKRLYVGEVMYRWEVNFAEASANKDVKDKAFKSALARIAKRDTQGRFEVTVESDIEAYSDVYEIVYKLKNNGKVVSEVSDKRSYGSYVDSLGYIHEKPIEKVAMKILIELLDKAKF